MKTSAVILFFCTSLLSAQTDGKYIADIYDYSLTNSHCYSWLDHLSNKIGQRLSGSAGAEKAVAYTKLQMETLGLDSVWLQPVMVPKWERGEKETAYILDGKKKTNVPVCALGNSIATPKNGILAEIVEVRELKELETLGREKLKGKIVFFNRPMNPSHIETFEAYGNAVDQRGWGAREASKYGAVAVIVRSMTLRLDDFPHTGSLNYGDIPETTRIAGAAISTNAAEKLSSMLKQNPNLRFFIKQSCRQLPDVLSYNVIGEIKGKVYPERIMTIGGHLDSWDLGDGSHDDGAGIVQSMEVAEIFRQIGYKPKNTIRIVLFMNEENGLRGGRKYAEEAALKKEKHIFALESDSGGFSPNGFSIESSDADFERIYNWRGLFKPYMADSFTKGHSGADIGPLESEGIVKLGLKPDSQRYFDYHHAANDKFDAVNKRELELGAATMAAMVYLFDQHWD